VVPAWLYTLPAGTVWTSAAIFFADFTEPPGSDDPAGTLSDRYVITQQFNGIANQALIQYDSDPIALQVPTGAIPTGFSGVEAGAFQVVDVATNRDNGFTLVVEAASDVPEPSLILPLGASVVFLTTIARRKRRQIV
jgi:hypothetical protein